MSHGGASNNDSGNITGSWADERLPLEIRRELLSRELRQISPREGPNASGRASKPQGRPGDANADHRRTGEGPGA